MKALTFFSLILLAGNVQAQVSNLGSGLNNPSQGLGNGVGTQNAAPLGSSTLPTPALTNPSQTTLEDQRLLDQRVLEQQKMEDTSNFNRGAYGGSLGGANSLPSGNAMGTQTSPGTGAGVGTGLGSGTAPGVGSPTPANPNGPLP